MHILARKLLPVDSISSQQNLGETQCCRRGGYKTFFYLVSIVNLSFMHKRIFIICFRHRLLVKYIKRVFTGILEGFFMFNEISQLARQNVLFYHKLLLSSALSLRLKRTSCISRFSSNYFKFVCSFVMRTFVF